ncbi:putative cytochrome P450 superfamily [Helianthus annuus]|nr:putative cytochrome P450 superfamily [Helianthus annuus]
MVWEGWKHCGGKDCLEFRPDRWFSEPGEFKMESPYKFPVFQGGPRVCLGKKWRLPR